MNSKKIYIPQLRGAIFPDEGDVLRTGSVKAVEKAMENGEPKKDEKGRIVYDQLGDPQRCAIIKHKNRDGNYQTSFALILGPVFENSPDDGTDWSGPITLPVLPGKPGEELKIAGWYADDSDHSGSRLNVTISRVIDKDASSDPRPTPPPIDPEDSPF